MLLPAARLEEAKAARGLAEHRLKMTRIRAPSSGAITRRMVAVGQWVEVLSGLSENEDVVSSVAGLSRDRLRKVSARSFGMPTLL